MAEIVTVKNKYNIEIVKCCASCIHNIGAVTDTTRMCNDGEEVVKPHSLCGNWKMKPNLDRAGKGGGSVKKRHYLEWLRDYSNPMNLNSTLEDRQIEYEKQYGSRYLFNQ